MKGARLVGYGRESVSLSIERGQVLGLWSQSHTHTQYTCTHVCPVGYMYGRCMFLSTLAKTGLSDGHRPLWWPQASLTATGLSDDHRPLWEPHSNRGDEGVETSENIPAIQRSSVSYFSYYRQNPSVFQIPERLPSFTGVINERDDQNWVEPEHGVHKEQCSQILRVCSSNGNLFPI